MEGTTWVLLAVTQLKAELSPAAVDLAGLTLPPSPAGLAELAARKYKQAAKCFLLASFDHCDFPEVRGHQGGSPGDLEGEVMVGLCVWGGLSQQHSEWVWGASPGSCPDWQ